MKKHHFSSVVREIPEALSVKVNMSVYDLQRKGRDVIVLSLGESFFDLPLFSFRALKNWQRGFHYSSSLGIPELCAKISAYYKKCYGVSSNPDRELLVSAGSKIVIYMALHSVLDPGDEAIILEPAWVSYTEQVRSCYGVPVCVPYNADLKNLVRYRTKRTRVIIVNNPNNPSGKVYSREELATIYTFAKKNNLYVISDEAYSDFVDTEPFISMGRFDVHKERVIVVNSLSKNLGMSGWRIGYVIAHADIIQAILKLNQHLITCPATLIEYYLVEHLDEILKKTKAQIQAVVQKRSRLKRVMDRIGLGYLPGTGTFYFLVSLGSSKLKSMAFGKRLLNEYGVAVVPGIGYGKSVDQFVRVGVGTESEARIQKGFRAMQALIEKTS